MIAFDATPTLVVAAGVWALWRGLLWWRNGGDVLREAAVASLFLWSLFVVRVTFFPLNIIFYDWHGRFSLVPFASIVQLLTETSPRTAVVNIVGNLLLFVPLGLLLPVLFSRLRSLPALLWRAAAVSIAIEVAQLFTRARAVDVDDIIINVAGASLGFAVYAIVASIARRSAGGAAMLERLGANPGREPLLLGAVPVGATAVLVVPVMISMIMTATLGDGPGGIVTDATGRLSGSSLVYRADVAEHSFLVLHAPESEQLMLVSYERVLPGRYTWVGSGEAPADGRSRFGWTVTAFNVARGERPSLIVWGANHVGATTVEIAGDGWSNRLTLPDEAFFAVGFRLDAIAVDAPSLELDIRLLDGTGRDVTTEFLSLND